ncbi:hypothetical protein VTN96DRAFT_6712 [Rasamsonia emersonii]
MRTRSQAVSPSGFVSLEDVPRRRKTRAQASTSPSKDAKSTVKKPATKPAPAKRGRKAATKKKASTKKATKTQDESSAAEDAETQAESGPSTATPEKPKQDETTKATGFNALKRSFDEISADNENGENDHDNEVAATPSQKRRITGPPGSTPFAHRTTPRRYTANMKSYSEQRRRRELEAKGQITATLFRLPQLVAQQEAKAAAEESENPAVDETDPFVEKPNAEKSNTLNDEGEPAASSEPAAEPRTPETPRSAWGIRSFLGSVPRSLSRFLPTLTSSADRGTPSVTTGDAVVAPGDADVSPTPSGKKARGQVDAEKQIHRDLSYSLFPAGLDKRLYLGDARETPSKAESRPAIEKPAEKDTLTPLAEVENAAKKRKRAPPSPDVIPNPVGVSYGMDLDFFTYSSPESEESDTADTPQIASALQTPAPTTGRSDPRPRKRVRFDTSPQDTPSKIRARATDPYVGRQFIGLEDPFVPRPEGPPSLERPTDAAEPAEHTPRTAEPAAEPMAEPSTPTPSTPATPSLPPASAFDSEALAKARSQAEKYKPKTPSGLRTSSRYSSSPLPSPSERTPTTKPTPVKPATTEPAATEPTTTEPATTEATPSKLATPAQPATPPEPVTTEPATAKQVTPTEPTTSAKPVTSFKPTTPGEPITLSAEELHELKELFGEDDEYARDAYELYRNCPTGDLRKLSWPESGPQAETLGAPPEAVKLVKQMMTPEELDFGYEAFCEGFDEFKKSVDLTNDLEFE